MANSSFFGTSGTTASVTNTIQTSVDAAAASATASATSATASETAKTASQTAQAASEAARDVALTHRDNAETHKNNALQAKTDAETAKTGAETARTDSQTAKTASEAARDLSASHRDDAQKLALNAEDSQFTLADNSTGFSALHYNAKAQAAKTAAEAALTSFQGQYSTGSSDPTSGLNDGDLFFNTTSDEFKVYDGSAWQSTTLSSSELTNISTVAGQISPTNNISSVAGKATEIGLLGTTDAIADMNTLGTSSNVTNMATLANVSSNITTVANNLSGVNSFAERYRVGSSDPSSNNDAGDLFYNTASSALKVYNASTAAWEQGVTAGSGFLPTTGGGLTGNLTLNNANLIFEGSTADANETSLTATDPTADRTITLPDKTGTVVTVAADGSTGQLLRTDGSGNYSFVTVSTNLSGDSNPTLSGNLDVGTHDIISSSNNDISLLPNGSGKVIMDGNGSTGGISITDGLMEMRSGNSSPAQIDLYCEVSNAHKVSIKAPAHANYSGNVNFTLPAGNGSNGQFLQTDGSGNLSYATVNTDLSNDTSPQLSGVLDTNGNNIEFGDSTGAEVERLKFGADDDLQIYHDGNHSIINDTGTGSLLLVTAGDFVQVQTGTDVMAKFIKDSAVELYHDNAKKIATTSGGIDVTGNIVVSGTVDGRDLATDGTKLDGIATSATAVGGSNGVDFNDNVKARFGTGNDLEIYHDGGSSFIADVGSGNLTLLADEFRLNNSGNTENMITAVPDGAVSLYHNDSKKIETTSGGIDVTGDVLTDTLTLDNSSNDWQFSVSGNNLIISYGGTSKAKLDSSGNLTVVGNVTAFGTI